MVEEYLPSSIEKKWQKRWAEDQIYLVKEDSTRCKYYALTMFPYTSGDLHIGHWYAMAPSDAHARFRRMQGYNVLHPMGFDAFGLPAENAAIKRGIHPYDWTMQNIANMREQLKSMGPCYDWSREVITCLPEYYRWTQWFFLKLYEHDLAYRALAPVNWCPNCQAVLANEQVVEGACWRCGSQVERRDLVQWFFRITKYADELAEHRGLEWPEKIKAMQRNWVGRSEGANINFTPCNNQGAGLKLTAFTTRPDTVFGVTFLAIAPEHPLLGQITTPGQAEAVSRYVEMARGRSDIERLSSAREKDGAFTGAYAINPVNGERVPIWVADYVLLHYGTGIVMGVPAHDERDYAFASRYNLPIRVVVTPRGGNMDPGQAYTGTGIVVNSGVFSGLDSNQAIKEITGYLEKKGLGGHAVSYKLRDWLISRQRYWGAPIPIIYCPHCGTVPVPEEDLPVLLPMDVDFKTRGESPLKYHEGFVNTTCPRCGAPSHRETDTMDTFMCSSWYYLRYTSPKCSEGPFEIDKMRYWMPVDLYTGGAEHAVMHLFYSRFFIKALRDMGLVDFDEPFIRLFNQGTIIAHHQKMSKSRGNVITPDTYVAELGADTVRLYLMFLGPWDEGGEWNDQGISGVRRWLGRIWNLVLTDYTSKDNTEDYELQRMVHKTIRRVTEDMEALHLNTMIAALMEFTNYLGKVSTACSVGKEVRDEAIEKLLLLLAPLAPHISEELWEKTGHAYSIHMQSWPKWDEALTQDEQVTIVVQVNGRLRDKLTTTRGIGKEEAVKLALQSKRVQSYLNGRNITQSIYIADRLINFVVE